MGLGFSCKAASINRVQDSELIRRLHHNVSVTTHPCMRATASPAAMLPGSRVRAAMWTLVTRDHTMVTREVTREGTGHSQENIRPRVLSQEVTVRVVTRDHKGLCDKSNKQRSEK